MARVTIQALQLLSRRSLVAVAENLTVKPAVVKSGTSSVRGSAVGVRARTEQDEGSSKEYNADKKVFWMRDPKTGNWIPESHFGEVDVADLREKLLPANPRLNKRL